MQVELFITRKHLKEFVNIFLKENNLIIYYQDDKKKVIPAKAITDDMLLIRDLIINVGKVESYKNIEIELQSSTLVNGKDGFINIYNELYENERIIVNSTIIWKTTNKDEKKYGKLLLDKIKKECRQGLIVEEKQFEHYNNYFKEYYWSNDVFDCKDRLYMSGGVVKVQPIL